MSEDLLVLQVIHVTDLHVTHLSANPVHGLNGRRRFAARLMQYMVERFDLFDWNEGTQGHYPKAPDGFARFLKNWRKRDERWYGTSANKDSVQTWLVDTGDLTAYGDDDSLKLGRKYLSEWCATLDCQLRSLFGNHDAWPGMLPMHTIIGYLPGEIEAQRKKIRSHPWNNTGHWVNEPLSIQIPGTDGSRIELYALDTVSWGATTNTLAMGVISNEDFENLRTPLRDQWAKSKTRHFRLLALHHPLAFPYTFAESHSLLAFPSMALWNANKWAHELRNDRDDPCGFGPLVHLFLSGHTHISYPAGALPSDVTDIHQGPLGRAQLQLVGGPLMLNKSANAARAATNGKPAQFEREKELYVPATMDASNCQAQILRFYANPDTPGRLKMIRIPVNSEDGSVYVDGDPSVVEMYYDT